MDGKRLYDLIVVKRSGQRVPFNGLKIAVAIKKAFDSVPNNYKEEASNQVYFAIIHYIKDNYQDRKTINVEDIQDIIEMILKKYNYLDIYNHFVEYRLHRSESRKVFTTKQQHKFVKVLEEVNLIDNKNIPISKFLNQFTNLLTNEYAKAYLIDNKYIRALEEGRIFIHNLSSPYLGTFPNLSLELEDNKYFVDAVIDKINILQNEINEEVCLNNFNNLYAKYILKFYKEKFKDNVKKYINLTGYNNFIKIKCVDEIIDCMLSMDCDLTNFDNLFVNYMSKEILKKAYIDTLSFVDEKIANDLKRLLFAMNNLNKTHTLIFNVVDIYDYMRINKIFLTVLKSIPVIDKIHFIFRIKENIPEELMSDLLFLLKNSNHHIYFQFLNIKNNKEKDDIYLSDGMRISLKENIKSHLNIATTSINMARLGIKYQTLNNAFYDELNEIIDLVKNQLLSFYDILGNKTIQNYNGLFQEKNLNDCGNADQKIRKNIKNGTLNINLIGLVECAYAIDKDNYLDIILKLIKYINLRIANLTSDNKMTFTLSAINYSIDSSYFINLDKTLFGLIDDVTNKKCYSNVVDSYLSNDFSLSKYLTGGFCKDILISKKENLKSIKDILIKLTNEKPNFVRMRRNFNGN